MTHVLKERLADERGRGFLKGEADGADTFLREKVGEMPVAAAPIEHVVAGGKMGEGFLVGQSILRPTGRRP